MMMLPSDLSPTDINQWLNHGWFIVRGNAADAVCSLTSADWPTMYVRDTKGKESEAQPRHITVHWPMCGAVNLDKYAVILSREAQQQYRRTYNSRCLTLEVPRKWDVMKRLGTDAGVVTPDTPEVVEAAFNPSYASYANALERIADGAVSVALNPYLILASDGTNMLVYYRGRLSAKIEGNKLVPTASDADRVGRLIKFFDGRVSL